MKKPRSQKYKNFTKSTLKHALMWGDFIRRNGHWNKSDVHTYMLMTEEIKRLEHEYYLDQKNKDGNSENNKRAQTQAEE